MVQGSGEPGRFYLPALILSCFFPSSAFSSFCKSRGGLWKGVLNSGHKFRRCSSHDLGNYFGEERSVLKMGRVMVLLTILATTTALRPGAPVFNRRAALTGAGGALFSWNGAVAPVSAEG